MQKQVSDQSSFPAVLSRVADVRVPLDGESGDVAIAVWVVPPLNVSELLPTMWILCFPGATYRGLAYYDRQVPGYTDWTWSMARFLAQQGIGSVILDNVGTGESRVALPGERITCQFVADVYRQVVAQVRERLLTGTLFPGSGPASRLWLAGVGHSLGGFLLVQTQSQCEACFDGLAVLGWGYHPANSLPDTGVEPEALIHGWVQRAQNGYVLDVRSLLRPFLYSSEVPEVLIRADEDDATVVPLGLLMDVMQPGGRSEQSQSPAGRIHCPVYLGYGETDVVPNPRIEPAAFSAAVSITLFIQEGAAHCTNFAEGRFTLWHDLAGWCRLRAVQRKGRGAIPFATASGQH